MVLWSWYWGTLRYFITPHFPLFFIFSKWFTCLGLSKDNVVVVHNKELTRLWSISFRWWGMPFCTSFCQRFLTWPCLSPNNHTYETSNNRLSPLVTTKPFARLTYLFQRARGSHPSGRCASLFIKKSERLLTWLDQQRTKNDTAIIIVWPSFPLLSYSHVVVQQFAASHLHRVSTSRLKWWSGRTQTSLLLRRYASSPTIM